MAATVFGLVHLEICSLGASDRVEWFEVERVSAWKFSSHDESYPCPRDTLGSLHSDQNLVFLTGILLARHARGVRLDVCVGMQG